MQKKQHNIEVIVSFSWISYVWIGISFCSFIVNEYYLVLMLQVSWFSKTLQILLRYKMLSGYGGYWKLISFNIVI